MTCRLASRSIRRASLCLALAVTLPSAAQAQAALRRYRELCELRPPMTLMGATDYESFGALVQRSGDMNGDGIGDLLVGVPDLRRPGNTQRGGLRIYSMPQGDLLWSVDGEPNAGLGYHAATLGHLDGDGVPDFVVAGWNTLRLFSGVGFQPRGVWKMRGFVNGVDFMGDIDGDGIDEVLALVGSSVLVLSGADGRALHELNSSGSDERPASATRIADFDGDGVAEFLITRPDLESAGVRGEAHVHSGASAALLHVLRGDDGVFSEHYGRSWAGRLGDVDADGTEDFFISDTRVIFSGAVERGRVYVYSGATLARLFALEPHAEDGGRLGTGRGWVGDVDGDGHDDMLFGHDNGTWAPEGFSGAAAFSIYSGRDGSLLRRLHGRHASEAYGRGPTGIGDVDGDGVPDVIVGRPRWFGPVSISGEVHLISLRHPQVPRYACPGAPNSTGRSGKLSATGRLSVAHDELTLRGANMPPDSLIDIFYALRSDAVPFASSGCLRGRLYRAARQVIGISGNFGITIPLSAGPLAAGSGAISAGSTWTLQGRYSDGAAGGHGFTNTVELTFCP